MFSCYMSKNVLNIGILGGSFDPVTNAHLYVANGVLDSALEIDEIWMMPVYRHQFNKNSIPAHHRKAMIDLISTRNISYCGFEVDQKLECSTYETLTQLIEKFGASHSFSFIVGSDCVLDFDSKWKSPLELSQLLPFIIIPRIGYALEEYMGLLSEPPHRLLKNVTPPELSSSELRKRVGAGEDVRNLVPAPVLHYIEQNQLYSNDI